MVNIPIVILIQGEGFVNQESALLRAVAQTTLYPSIKE